MTTRWPLAFLAAALAWPQPPAKDSRALLAGALAAEKAGRTQAAVRQFEALLRASPPLQVEGQARLELVRIHQRRGEWWRAARQLERLRELAPDDPEYAYQLGVAYRSLAKWAFEKMRALAPQSARVQQIYGEQYSVTGDTAKAIAAFRQAIAADPKLEGSHLALAILYLRLNKRDEALAEIDRELEIAPASASAKQVRQAIQAGAP